MEGADNTRINIHSGKKIWYVSYCLIFFFLSPAAQAQNEWSLTLKSGVHIPTEEFDAADLKTGFGLEGTLSYEVTSFLSAYAGWSWNRFAATQSFAGSDVDFEETGYTFGVQFQYPATVSRITYQVSLGGLYNHLEIEDNSGNTIADSGHGLGTQVETGIIIMLNKHFHLTPYGRYRLLPSDFELDHKTTSLDLRYISIGLGLSYIF